MKLFLIFAMVLLGLGAAQAETSHASGKGCITIQGVTQCGDDIPNDPTPVCNDPASCDSGANSDPTPPDEAGGTVTDDDNTPDAQTPPTGTTSTESGGGSTPTEPTTQSTTTESTTTVTYTTEAPPETTLVAPAPPPLSYCQLTPTADIGVAASSATRDYTVGQMVNFTLDVFDNGPCEAASSALTFQLPKQLELLSPSAVVSPEGTCDVTGGVGSQLVTCAFGTVTLGHHLGVNVSARADNPGTATAVAGVSTTAADPNVGDNQISEVTIVVSTASPNRAKHLSQSVNQVVAQGYLVWDNAHFSAWGLFMSWLSARGGSTGQFQSRHPVAAEGLKALG